MDDNDFVDFHIVLPQIVSNKSLLSVTRMLATDLISNPYMTVGVFFRMISSADLQLLLEIVEEGDDSAYAQDLVLIQQMLHAAEGLGQTFGTLDECVQRLQVLATLVVVASLDRKGLCKAAYENFSFDEALRDKPIAHPL